MLTSSSCGVGWEKAAHLACRFRGHPPRRWDSSALRVSSQGFANGSRDLFLPEESLSQHK